MCWQIEVQRQDLRLMTMSWNKRFRMARKRSIFTLRTSRCCIGLLRDPVLALFSEVLKTQLDKAPSTQVWSHSWACLERSLNYKLPDVHSYLNFPMMPGYIISRSEANSFFVQTKLDKDRKAISLNWRCKDSNFHFLLWKSGPRINWTNPVVVQQRVGN